MTALRNARLAAGLTQAELARHAGVSRQLVGAVEAGRHLPRVDAAIALATALGADVAALFTPDKGPVDVVSGEAPAIGTLVRVGDVGGVTVTAPARVRGDSWDVADGIIDADSLDRLSRISPGFVVAGCEPGLEVLERILREQGMAAVAASSSNAAAIAALQAERVHAAVVHGSRSRPVPTGLDVYRFGLAAWHVGLAAPEDARRGWERRALSGRHAVIQREQGAGVQRVFESALTVDAPVPGPVVATHLESARRAVLTGTAGVTIEPAALAVGALFHPLEVHVAELWVDARWVNDRPVAEALNVLGGRQFQRQLETIGGYDLSTCGARLV